MPKEVLIISENIYDLKGVGEEWLISKNGGHVIARFLDGNIYTEQTIDNDATLILEDLCLDDTKNIDIETV
jgi:hypothetical protein